MQRTHPNLDAYPDSGRAPDLPYIRLQLLEAQAAARTLHELSPHKDAVEPLYEALRHALAEVARAIAALADHGV